MDGPSGSYFPSLPAASQRKRGHFYWTVRHSHNVNEKVHLHGLPIALDPTNHVGETMAQLTQMRQRREPFMVLSSENHQGLTLSTLKYQWMKRTAPVREENLASGAVK